MANTDDSIVQLTLDDENAEKSYSPESGAFRYCAYCDEFVLRSRWLDHFDHDWEARDDGFKSNLTIPELEDEDEEEEEVLEVGGVYDIRMDYTVTYSARVVAVNEHHAEEKAKDAVDYGNAVDAMHMHTDRSEVETIYEDDERAAEHDLLP